MGGKRLEQALAPVLGDAGAAVAHPQPGLAGVAAQLHGQRARPRRVGLRLQLLDRVVQQVAHQLAQGPFVAAHRAGLDVELEVDAGLGDQRREVQRDAAHDLGPVRHRPAFAQVLLAQLLDLGQGEHLVGQLGRALDGVADLDQRLGGIDVAAACRLDLRLEHRQRRAQLVRGVAHEALLVLEQLGQARHLRVGRLDDRLQLARRVCGRQRLEVGLGALAQACAELAHRPRRALHDGDHDRGDQRQQQGLLDQHLHEQPLRQPLAQLERLGELDGGHAMAQRARHRLAQHRHAHRLAAVGLVVEVHQCGVDVARAAVGPRSGQVGKTHHQLALEALDPEVEAAAVVGLEGLERAVRQRRAQPRPARLAADVEQLADRLG